MKRAYIYLLLTLLPLLAHAYAAYIDGLYYNFSGREATVTQGSEKYSGTIVIPQTVTYEEKTYTVTTIDDFAFYKCADLAAVTIGSGVTTIGRCAFEECTGLTSVAIGSSVTTISNGAFKDCYSLTSAIIPAGATSIGYEAFSGCTSLVRLSIPNSVSSIGNEAFKDCARLTTVIIPDGVTSIGNYVFAGCSALTSVYIPATVTEIGGSAFCGCSNLDKVTIPPAVTSIGAFAFSDCSLLSAVTIPASVTSIGVRAFGSCASLSSIKIESGNPEYDSREGCNAIVHTASNVLLLGCNNTTIPSSVTAIGDNALENCTGLRFVRIPIAVTSIGSDAFKGCSGLTTIIVDQGNTVYDSREGCNAIIHTESDELLYGCASTVIPASVTSIANWAFTNCLGLTQVTIPSSVTRIGNRAFSGCSNVRELTYADGCSTALSTGLTSIIRVTIPSSVSSIGNWAFDGCANLSDIYCRNTMPPYCGTRAFTGVNTALCRLHVPIGFREDYAAAEGWSDFSNILDDDKTSVTAIQHQDGPAAYYTPGGIRIATPTRGGLYILRQNGRTRKVLTR